MRRPPHGATRCPGPSGPSNGYGRPVGRPGPAVRLTAAPAEPARLLQAGLRVGEFPGGEFPAPDRLPLDPAVTP
jgi:hypothetical protein